MVLCFWRVAVLSTLSVGFLSAVCTASRGVASENDFQNPVADAKNVSSDIAYKAPEAAPAARDEIGSGDKLKVTFFGNADLTTEARVQSDGTLTVPALGAFTVTGMTTSEIASEIATRFAQDGRRSPNNVVVQVEEWRPVFVTGSVSKPGSFAYIAGMNVLQAVSMAGGMYRIADGDILTFVNVAQNASRAEESKEQLKSYLARMAALKAEKAGESEFLPPARLLQIAGPDETESLVEVEKQALALRLQETSTLLSTGRHQVELLKSEREAYGEQLKAIEASLARRQKFLDDMTQLSGKGLARRSDVNNLEIDVDSLIANRREVLAQISRLGRELEKQEQDVIHLPLQRQIRIDQEIATLAQQTRVTEATLTGALSLVSKLSDDSGMILASNGSQAPKRTVAILRKGPDGKEVFVDAQFTDRLRPGDVVVVGKAQSSGGSGPVLNTNIKADAPKDPAADSAQAIPVQFGLMHK